MLEVTLKGLSIQEALSSTIRGFNPNYAGSYAQGLYWVGRADGVLGFNPIYAGSYAQGHY